MVTYRTVLAALGVGEPGVGLSGELARRLLALVLLADGSITRSWTIGGGSIGRRSANIIIHQFDVLPG